MSRWERCIRHKGAATLAFLDRHFSEPHRRCLLICSAGFDPRSPHVATILARVLGQRIRAIVLCEERPNAPSRLSRAAKDNLGVIVRAIPQTVNNPVSVFASDGAVTGGREAIRIAQQIDTGEVTDIVVDCSTLSVGVNFPLVRYLLDATSRLRRLVNLHLMITHEPSTDGQIVATPSDRAELILGFRGGLHLEQNRGAARLWVPHLIAAGRATLGRIYAWLEPHDVCPVIPFPASRPRLGDELCEHYQNEFSSAWDVDSRNLVYADEGNPLDLYRTLLRMESGRARGFAEIGGSKLVLSPIGGRALAVGALMAAVERDFPVVYVEAVGHSVTVQDLVWSEGNRGDVIHVWLSGEAYA